MEKLIHEFGINPWLLGAQVVNFLIILFVLKKFLYKPILEVLDKRKTAISQGIKNSEEAAILLEKAKESERKALKEAQLSAKKIIEEAQRQSDSIIAHAQVEARKTTEKMITDAKVTIEEEVKKTEIKLATRTSKLAIEYLEKALSGFFTPKEQNEIVKKVEKKLKGNTN